MCEINSIQSCMDSYSNEDLHAQTQSNIQVQKTKTLRYHKAFKVVQDLNKENKNNTEN